MRGRGDGKQPRLEGAGLRLAGWRPRRARRGTASLPACCPHAPHHRHTPHQAHTHTPHHRAAPGCHLEALGHQLVAPLQVGVAHVLQRQAVRLLKVLHGGKGLAAPLLHAGLQGRGRRGSGRGEISSGVGVRRNELVAGSRASGMKQAGGQAAGAGGLASHLLGTVGVVQHGAHAVHAVAVLHLNPAHTYTHKRPSACPRITPRQHRHMRAARQPAHAGHCRRVPQPPAAAFPASAQPAALRPAGLRGAPCLPRRA